LINLHKNILADPQTSGGLLMAVSRESLSEVVAALNEYGLADRTSPIGELVESRDFTVSVL
jgi:selenide,water dikinase